MFTPMMKLMRWKTAAACAAFMLLTLDAAKPAEQGIADQYLCAEREILLQTLLEAHGEVSNAWSPELAERNILIVKARTACHDGRVNDALPVYDRLITKLASVVTYRGQQEYGIGDANGW